MIRSLAVAAAALTLASLPASNVFAGVIFGVDGASGSPDQVIRINSDGSVVAVLFEDVSTTSNPRGVAYDATNNRAYFADIVDRAIYSVDATTGAGLQSFPTSGGTVAGAPASASFDSANGRVYIYEGNAVDAIVSYPIGGSPATVFYADPASTLNANTHSFIDGSSIFFGEDLGTTGQIVRADLTTGIATPIYAHDDDGIRGLVVNGDDLYFVSNDNDRIHRLDISGPSTATLLSFSELDSVNGATPQGLATDGSFLYYAEGNTSTGRGIYRYNLDLTGRTQIFSGDSTLFFFGVAGAPDVAAIPEPSTWAALASIAAVLVYRRRRRSIAS